jgi:hypothetical protein
MKSVFIALTLAALSVAPAARAQAPAPQPFAPDFSKVEIESQKLADDCYVLEGQGGVLAGPEGLLPVDAQFAPLTGKIVLQAEVKTAKRKS